MMFQGNCFICALRDFAVNKVIQQTAFYRMHGRGI